MSYNINLEEINCILGEKNKHAVSGNSHLSTLAHHLTAHRLTGICLLQLGTENQVPSMTTGGIFPLGRQIRSSAFSCSSVKLSLMFWHPLSCPTASHWKVRPFWSTRFVRGCKGSSVPNGEWHCLIILPSERIQHEILSPGTPGHGADTEWIAI